MNLSEITGYVSQRHNCYNDINQQISRSDTRHVWFESY